MGEDAAATARRIVEEVLARAGSGPTDAGADASAPAVRRTPPATPAIPAAAHGGRGPSEAERIARRIVEEVLEAATEAGADLSVSGVPRGGLSAPGEQTAEIVAPPAETPPSDPPAATRRVQRPTASVPPVDAGGTSPPGGPPDPTPPPVPGVAEEDSADDIVRRIVADVQAERLPEFGARDDTAATTRLPGVAPQEPAEVTTRLPDAADEPASPQAVLDPGTVEMPLGGGPDAAGPERGETAGGTSTQVVAGPDGTPVPDDGAVPGAPGRVDAVDDAPARPLRPLVGWADPPEPVEVAAPEDDEPAARTLRWLLASLLGAIALAVLFPLAVAALRALVSMG